MNGHGASRDTLASPANQALIVQLLPAAISHLNSVLVESPEQQRQKARMEAYTGAEKTLLAAMPGHHSSMQVSDFPQAQCLVRSALLVRQYMLPGFCG